MADLKYIEYPHHLNEHTLTQQELAPLNVQQQALAKDWNISNRKLDWVIHELVNQHNLMVDHDRLLDSWKFWLKTGGVVFGSSGLIGIVFIILRIMGKA